MQIDEIPRVSLVHEPTPLHLLDRLSLALGGVQVWCKRDDLTRLALGGNKLRKLEFLLREALDQGADTVITTGAAQSNHARLTAAAAASLGLRTILVLGGPKIGLGQGNLLLDELVGAEVRLQPWASWDEAAQVLEDVAAEVRESGRRPYVVPLGGTNALGVLGYVLAAREIAQQTAGHPPRAVLCASSSGGTQAGLLLGQRLYHLPFEVIGIAVGQPAAQMVPKVAALATAAAALLDADPVPESAVVIRDEYIGLGYGQLDAATAAAIRTVASMEGILLDPVYTGKAMAGLLDMARGGQWKAGERVVFLHTGGVPALFAYWDALVGHRNNEKR